jgi:hypothetical protein
MSLYIHSISALLILLFTISPVSAEDTRFDSDHFSGSGNCSQCHDGLKDSEGEDVSIVRAWSGSMMANAAKDPLWQAKVATELKRNPHLEDVINDKCTQCHAPMANFESEEQVTIFGEDGLLDPSNSLHDAAMNAVSCTYCHQIEDSAILGTEEGFSGNAEISDRRVAYGPFYPVDTFEMTTITGHEPVFSEHISSSALCATCHNLKTPYVDASGEIAGDDFPEQMPYTEWENSIFDDAGSNPTSCQDCHMPTTTAVLSTRPGSLPAREGFARHNFAGANTVMLTLLKENADTLGIDTGSIDENIALSRQLLQEAVSLEILSAEMEGEELVARLKLTNNSGHKTPTSFPSRRMWLHFRVTDADGNLVFESGAINPDGSIDGANNDTDPSMLEPHYDLITSSDQVQIYESVLGNTDGNVTQTLLRAAEYLKDNRLTPAGFDKNRVPYDVAVQGGALDDLNFNEGLDEITYRIKDTGTGDYLLVEVNLNYQPLSHGMLEDLFKDNDLEQVSNFESMYDSLTLKHETMASAETVVERSDIQTGGGGGIGAMMIMLLSLLVAVRRCLREKTVLRDQLPFRNLFDTGLRRKPLMRTSVNQ